MGSFRVNPLQRFKFWLLYNIYRYSYFKLWLNNVFLCFLFTLIQLYQTVNEDPPMIQMVISANQSCEGLSNIQQSEPTVSKGSRHFSDGSVALLFSEDLPQTVVWRKKRSEEEGGGCRLVS